MGKRNSLVKADKFVVFTKDVYGGAFFFQGFFNAIAHSQDIGALQIIRVRGRGRIYRAGVRTAVSGVEDDVFATERSGGCGLRFHGVFADADSAVSAARVSLGRENIGHDPFKSGIDLFFVAKYGLKKIRKHDGRDQYRKKQHNNSVALGGSTVSFAVRYIVVCHDSSLVLSKWLRSISIVAEESDFSVTEFAGKR